MLIHQSAMHLKLHHKQNNTQAMVLFTVALFYTIYQFGIAKQDNTKEGDRSTQCSCEKEIHIEMYLLGLLALITIVIVWVLNYLHIEKSRRTIIDTTIDEVNFKNNNNRPLN